MVDCLVYNVVCIGQLCLELSWQDMTKTDQNLTYLDQDSQKQCHTVLHRYGTVPHSSALDEHA